MSKLVFFLSFVFLPYSVVAAEQVRISFTGLVIEERCVVSTKTSAVDLGTLNVGQINNPGVRANSKVFTIAVDKCANQKVMLRLVGSPVTGRTNLLRSGGSAENVGIAIWDEGLNKRFDIGTETTALSVGDSGKANFNFRISIESLGKITTGTINGTAVFELIYL